MSQNEIITIKVNHDYKDKRVDKYLVSRFPDYSRTFIQGLINSGKIHTGNRAIKNSYEVKKGDVIAIELPELEGNEIEPEDIPLVIIFEDDHLLVINKPPDMVVHPARGHARGTLVNALAHYCNRLSGVNGPLRPGIVHRLDRDTSGVIIVAKTDQAHCRIAHQFENREVKKEYIAVVYGEMGFDSDVITAPLGRHVRFREKVDIRYDIGKASISRYEVVERYKGFTMVKVFPKTGRTHQIRVHMRHIGYPIVADSLYSRKDSLYMSDLLQGDINDDNPLIERQALHAARIGFIHPVSNKLVEFEAQLPDDMTNLINGLRKYR